MGIFVGLNDNYNKKIILKMKLLKDRSVDEFNYFCMNIFCK